MKPSLVVLLVLSLAGNAALAVFVLNRTSASAAPAVATSNRAVATAAAPAGATVAVKPAAPEPATWQALKPNANLHDMVANLRAAGFPAGVVRAIAYQMISDRIDTSEVDGMPFWKQNYNNADFVAAQQKMSAQRRDLANELLGPDAKPSAAMDPAAKQRRYGSLSDDKIDQLDNITREFSEMRSKLSATRKPGDTAALINTGAAMEQEMHNELATVLSPAELEQYEMRASSASSRVMSSVKSIELNEAEFTALFRAQKAFDAANPPFVGGIITPDMQAQRVAAQDQLNTQARATLSDDRFYEYLKGADPSYARTAQFTANYPSITPAMTYDLTRLERDSQTAALAVSRDTSMSPADRGAQFQAMRKEYQDKLAALLGPEVATAYTNRNRPPGSTATAPTPAVRIGP